MAVGAALGRPPGARPRGRLVAPDGSPGPPTVSVISKLSLIDPNLDMSTFC